MGSLGALCRSIWAPSWPCPREGPGRPPTLHFRPFSSAFLLNVLILSAARTPDPSNTSEGPEAQRKLNASLIGAFGVSSCEPPPGWVYLHRSRSPPGPGRSLPFPPCPIHPFSLLTLPSEPLGSTQVPRPRSVLLPLASSIDGLRTVPFPPVRNHSSWVPCPRRPVLAATRFTYMGISRSLRGLLAPGTSM